MKKILTIILVSCFLFNFSFSCFAADGTDSIKASDMDLTVEVSYSGDSTGTDVTADCETLIWNSTSYSQFNGFFTVKLPASIHSDSVSQFVLLSDNFKVTADHEYDLSFEFGSFGNYTQGIFSVHLIYYDSIGTEIKNQTLYVSNEIPNNPKSVDFSFKPDVSDIDGGYTCQLKFAFLNTGKQTSNMYYCISEEINLIDKDDDSGWFQKILNKINDVWESIKSLPDKIGAFIQNIASDISEGLKELFIPSENYFNDKLSELQTFFDEKFGVFAFPFTLIISILELYNNVGNGTGILHLNEFSIGNNVFLEARDINLKELILNFSQELYVNSGIDLYEIYLAFIDVIILFAFVRLIKNKYDKMINNGSFDNTYDIMNESSRGGS